MRGRTLEWKRRFRGLLLGLGALACASTATDTAGTVKTLHDVQVGRDGDATVVTLVGVQDPVYTAYLQQDPQRLTVDLASVQLEAMRDPIAVYDGLVEEIAVAPFSQGTGDGSTRVDVTLAADAEYQVTPAAEGLSIRIQPLLGMAAAAPAEMPTAATIEALPAAPAAPADRLSAVDVRTVDGGLVVQLHANGAIDSAGSFTLEDPDRLVIDLPGMQSAVGKEKIQISSPEARQLRIGQHDGMLRVVLDGGPAAHGFEGRRVVPVGDGLVLALGAGAALDEAVDGLVAAAPGQTASQGPWAEAANAAKDVPPAKIDASDDVATVQGVEFDNQGDRDRITVIADRPVDYVVHQPDADTVVVSVAHARLQPTLDPRIAPTPGGPVSLVTAFEQPEMNVPEVRVVVERAANLEPQVRREGSLVVIEFPHGGSVAATPPILGSMPADAAAPAAPKGAADATVAAASKEGAAERPMPAGKREGAAGQAPPASLEPPAAIAVLREGGLSDEKVYSGRRISLDFKDIDMADVLRLIADVSDLNVIAGDEVKGKVTIRLVDVPWDQALDVVLLTKGLAFMRVGNVLRIAPADLLKKEEEAKLQERRALEQLEDLVVKLQPVNYTNVKEVQKMVKPLLSPRGSVETDKRTNTLIIKDVPSVVDEATALIKAVDTQTPQVLIEAKIVEANLDFSREFGVVWGFGANPTLSQHSGHGFELSDTPGATGASFLNSAAPSPTALFGIAGSMLDDKVDLGLTLRAAEANGDGKVISSPRLVTLDNSKATIEQGVSIPFQTFENGDAQLEFVDAVLKLDVTPHITSDRSIVMKIAVSRNAPDATVVTLTGSPAIAKNQVDTETLVKDGQTLVIGGIYVVDKSDKHTSVPFLGNIPLVGALFRNSVVKDSRKELLIFVTPRVVQQAPAAT